MKNPNLHFKATARFVILLLLTCFAALFPLIPTPAVGRDRVPFNGNVSGSGSVPTLPHVGNTGVANQLGAFTGSAEFYPDLSNLAYIAYTGAFDWKPQLQLEVDTPATKSSKLSDKSRASAYC